MTNRRYDPYRTCPQTCNHDLAPGVLVSDLMRGDGPNPSLELMLGFGASRAIVYDITPSRGDAGSAA